MVYPVVPSQTYSTKPYTGHGKSFRKGGSSYRRGDRDRIRMDPHPSATATKPSKSGDGQATMTVTVPQDSNKRKVQRNEATSCAKLQGRAWRSQGKKKQSEWGRAPPPPQSVSDGGTTMPVLEGWKHITNDPYVLSIVSKGYRLRFTSPPLLRKAPWEIRSPKGPQKIQRMREQILYPLCFNRSNHQSTSGYFRVLLERIPGTQGISRVASSINRLKTTENPHENYLRIIYMTSQKCSL